jgi:hypothetical protein
VGAAPFAVLVLAKGVGFEFLFDFAFGAGFGFIPAARREASKNSFEHQAGFGAHNPFSLFQ